MAGQYGSTDPNIMIDPHGTSVLIVAAGRGQRFGGETPKQYVSVAGISSLRRCLDTFLQVDGVVAIQVVIHSDDQALYQDAVLGVADDRLLPAVSGGQTRAASVVAGLQGLAVHNPKTVLVHDAARPFVSRRIIQDVTTELQTGVAAFAAIPVVDALWRVEEGQTQAPVARDNLWRAQTPQGFDFATLVAAHETGDGRAADDVEVVRAAGHSVRVVLGDPDNFKITTSEDLVRAERIAKS